MSSRRTTIVQNSQDIIEKILAVGEEENQPGSVDRPMDNVEAGIVEGIPSSLDPKKRKRDTETASELQIDVSAPEPPSKKALRMSKKHKFNHAPDVTGKLTGSPRVLSDGVVVMPELLNPAADIAKHSPYSIWIGNLPWTTTRPVLLTFLTGSGTILKSQISRIHMPLPAKAEATKTRLKPQNKGFAYIDFSTKEALNNALGLSETLMGGRRVLIKDAKSFEGRPIKKTVVADEAGDLYNKKGAKPPSRRIFIGNLGFDVTNEDLIEHFQPCGEVVGVHMATFEDSGKCKGYAWVTFEKLDAAGAAVKGSILLPEKTNQDEEIDAQDDATKEVAPGEHSTYDFLPEKAVVVKPKRKPKMMRKWFVNRLRGRLLRCEFAEDAVSRYKKRYSKESTSVQQRENKGSIDDNVADSHVEVAAREGVITKQGGKLPRGASNDINPGAPTDPEKRRGRTIGTRSKNEATKALDAVEDKEIARGRYRTGAITESQGTKVTFD